MRRFLKNVVLALVLGLVGLVGAALANHHINGQAQIQGRGSGKHVLHQRNGYSSHAHVNQGGKVSHVSVSRQNKSHKVTRFKTSRRKHALGNTHEQFFVSTSESGAESLTQTGGGVFVGFGYFDQTSNRWVIFWFSIGLVEGGDSGARDISDQDPGNG